MQKLWSSHVAQRPESYSSVASSPAPHLAIRLAAAVPLCKVSGKKGKCLRKADCAKTHNAVVNKKGLCKNKATICCVPRPALGQKCKSDPVGKCVKPTKCPSAKNSIIKGICVKGAVCCVRKGMPRIASA